VPFEQPPPDHRDRGGGSAGWPGAHHDHADAAAKAVEHLDRLVRAHGQHDRDWSAPGQPIRRTLVLASLSAPIPLLLLGHVHFDRHTLGGRRHDLRASQAALDGVENVFERGIALALWQFAQRSDE
jgi:hypothetical protein